MKELSPWRIRHMAEPKEIQPEYSYVSKEEEFHLSHYWNILLKRRWMIILIFLFFFAFGAYFPFKATKLYTASATIKIEPQNPQITGVQAVEPLGTWLDYYPTQFALLRNRILAARVIADLKLDSNTAFTTISIVSPNPVDHVKSWISRILSYFTGLLGPILRSGPSQNPFVSEVTVPSKSPTDPAVPPGLVDRYLGFLNVAPIHGTRLVRVQFTTPDPALSQLLANAHVEAFIRMSLESRFNLTSEAREFLNDKIAELRAQFGKAEAALNKFRREHGVVSIERGENIVVDRLVDLNKQLTAARAQRIEAESLYRTVENKDYQDLAEVMRQGLVPQLKGNVATLEADLARVSTIFRPDHPRVQELDQQITAARRALNNEIANVVRGIRSSYTAALAREHGLEAETVKQQRDALNLKELGVEYTILQEEVNAHRSLYENVVKRLSETGVSSDLAVSNMQISERADRPRGASAPNISLYLLSSMISGLFLGLGLAFVREYFDSTVGTPEDVRRAIGLSTLGVVPHLKFLDSQSYERVPIGNGVARSGKTPPLMNVSRVPGKELIVNHRPISILSESYRTLRTSLLLSQAEEPPQVVLLTSPAPAEGKTTTTLNLSIALANDGYSVLIIDADMRRGSCHSRLGLRNKPGLSNVLTGGFSAKDGIQATSISGLHLLSRGVLPPNPSELLGSLKMRQLLQELRHDFKFILIDSPPIVAVSDATVLSAISDGVLLVLDAQNTSTPSAQKAVERLDMVRAHLLGVVLNGVNLDDPHYSYYRTYSSYYGYQANRDDELDVTSAEADVTDQVSNGAGDSDWSWSEEEESTNSSTTEDDGHKKTDADEAPVGSRVTSAEEANKPEAAAAPLHGSSSNGKHSGTALSPKLLDLLVAALNDAIGPIATLVVHEQITALGESPTAFPKQRLPELMRGIEREITKDELKRFNASIPEWLLEIAKEP